MINMAVGIQVADQFEIIPFNKAGDLLFLTAFEAGGINDHTFTGFIIQDIRVDLEGIENKFLYLYHSKNTYV
jgi:hypothetical protein